MSYSQRLGRTWYKCQYILQSFFRTNLLANLVNILSWYFITFSVICINLCISCTYYAVTLYVCSCPAYALLFSLPFLLFYCGNSTTGPCSCWDSTQKLRSELNYSCTTFTKWRHAGLVMSVYHVSTVESLNRLWFNLLLTLCYCKLLQTHNF
jgi:hypothetical protein